MFGCLGRLGCLVMLALIGVGGWFTRDIWYPRVRRLVVAEAPVRGMTWQPISADASTRAATVLAQLEAKNGPVFADLSPSEFAAWVVGPSMKILGAAAGAPEAAVHGDTLFVRASIAISELGDPKSLGPLASMLDGRQPVVIGGRLDVPRPGLAAFHVTHMSVKELRLPSRLVEQIVQRISLKDRPEGMAKDAVPLPLPANVADLRVTKGHVVLYKAVP